MDTILGAVLLAQLEGGGSDRVIQALGSNPAMMAALMNSAPATSKQPFQVIFPAIGPNEAFHVLLDLDSDVVQRWGFADNKTQEFQGEPFEGTTIDRGEPFTLRWVPGSH